MLRSDRRRPFRERRGHHCILRSGHRRFVEEHLRAGEAAWRRKKANEAGVSPRAPSASSASTCVWIRRRPMTSPPGGEAPRDRAARAAGPRAAPTRGLPHSVDPAAAVHAIRLQRDDARPALRHGDAESRGSGDRLDVADVRHVLPARPRRRSDIVAARSGSAAFLFPLGRIVPRRVPPSISKRWLSHHALV